MSTATDREVRSEFVYLSVQQAMEFLKKKPTRAQVEERSAIMREEMLATGNKHYIGSPELYRRPGSVMGRCMTAVHNIIHNLTLGDYVERNNRACTADADGSSGNRSGSGDDLRN